MPKILLTQSQIDFIAEACSAAMNEHARFLDEEVRRSLTQALNALGKHDESASMEP